MFMKGTAYVFGVLLLLPLQSGAEFMELIGVSYGNSVAQNIANLEERGYGCVHEPTQEALEREALTRMKKDHPELIGVRVIPGRNKAEHTCRKENSFIQYFPEYTEIGNLIIGSVWSFNCYNFDACEQSLAELAQALITHLGLSRMDYVKRQISYNIDTDLMHSPAYRGTGSAGDELMVILSLGQRWVRLIMKPDKKKPSFD